jgi:hypothetical protein
MCHTRFLPIMMGLGLRYFTALGFFSKTSSKFTDAGNVAPIRLTEETRGKRPRYYLQNFHFQSGGWMTEDSPERYDTQVEVLFTAPPMPSDARHCRSSAKSLLAGISAN